MSLIHHVIVVLWSPKSGPIVRLGLLIGIFGRWAIVFTVVSHDHHFFFGRSLVLVFVLLRKYTRRNNAQHQDYQQFSRQLNHFQLLPLTLSSRIGGRKSRADYEGSKIDAICICARSLAVHPEIRTVSNLSRTVWYSDRGTKNCKFLENC